jgi:hypothetical protein
LIYLADRSGTGMYIVKLTGKPQEPVETMTITVAPGTTMIRSNDTAGFRKMRTRIPLISLNVVGLAAFSVTRHTEDRREHHGLGT